MKNEEVIECVLESDTPNAFSAASENEDVSLLWI